MTGDADGLDAAEALAVDRAFGAENRRRLIGRYFDGAGEVTPANAWQHVYRLLLWINPTIGLAHCYESDKCQPHKAWYARSLAFHAWVSVRLGVPPAELREHIDHLFRSALPALAHVEMEARREAATKHLALYAGSSMPEPGDDPDLVDLIAETLGPRFPLTNLDRLAQRRLVERIYAHFAQENKRKNLLGRGFEDTLAAVIERLPGRGRWTVDTRVRLAAMPGFNPHGESEKAAEVDLALWRENAPPPQRILVSSKWSVRADRERQFDSDFDDYSKSNTGELFDYVLVTNEFDAARLDAACSKIRGNRYLFNTVVHVQPEAVLAAYGDRALRPPNAGARGRSRASAKLPYHLRSERLLSLEQWLTELVE